MRDRRHAAREVPARILSLHARRDGQQLDIEPQHRVGRNTGSALLAIAEMWWHEQRPPAADAHPLDAVSKARDDIPAAQVDRALDALLYLLPATEREVVSDRHDASALGEVAFADGLQLNLDAEHLAR